jgi:hypothetical protein
MGCDGFGIHHGHDQTDIRDLRRIAAIAADDTRDGRSNGLGVLQGLDEIRANILLEISTAHRTRMASLAFSRLVFSHSTKIVAQPSSLVRAVSSETLSVGIRFDSDDFPEIVDGMRAIAGTAADAEKKIARLDVSPRPAGRPSARSRPCPASSG